MANWSKGAGKLLGELAEQSGKSVDEIGEFVSKNFADGGKVNKAHVEQYMKGGDVNFTMKDAPAPKGAEYPPALIDERIERVNQASAQIQANKQAKLEEFREKKRRKNTEKNLATKEDVEASGGRLHTRDGYTIQEDGQLSMFDMPAEAPKPTPAAEAPKPDEPIKGQVTMEDAEKQMKYQRYKKEKAERLAKEEKLGNNSSKGQRRQREHEQWVERERANGMPDNIADDLKSSDFSMTDREFEHKKRHKTKEQWEAEQKETARRKAQSEADKAKYQEQKKINDAFDEAQGKIDKQNRGLKTKILDGTKDFINNVKEHASGESRRKAAQFATEYNEILRKNGNTNFIDIQGGRNLQWKHEGMSAQQIYDAQQKASEEAAAKAEEFSQWWAGKADGIANFAKENQMVTAAGIAGAAVIGVSLLDND